MTSLPPSLATALTAISSMMGQDPAVINVFTELWLYLENNKNKDEISEDVFVCSILSAEEICLSIQIAPASSQNDFMKLNALLDSGANYYDPLPGQLLRECH